MGQVKPDYQQQLTDKTEKRQHPINNNRQLTGIKLEAKTLLLGPLPIILLETEVVKVYMYVSFVTNLKPTMTDQQRLYMPSSIM
jgi:hypothetical protein